MKIVLASHNKKKLAELQTLLRKSLGDTVELVLPADVGITEEPEENGNSFLENACIKARSISERGYIAIADDSGLCVDALGGAPGIYSARYSGKGDQENINLLLSELQGVTPENRTARFVCCMVCTLPGTDRYLAVQETVEGHILSARDGEGGFGYDPVFFCDEIGMSFGQADGQTKNQVSHRGRAARVFASRLGDFLGK